MIIKSGDTVTIRAIVSPNSGVNGGTITWEPAEKNDSRGRTIARVVNANDNLLAACDKLLMHRHLGDLHPSDYYRLEQAVAEVKG